MNVTYRNGLPPSYLRVLTGIGYLQQQGKRLSQRHIAKAIGWKGSPGWICKVLRGLEENGLVAGVHNHGTMTVRCRFYTYEELNPKEEPNGTAGNATTAAHGEVRAAAPPG